MLYPNVYLSYQMIKLKCNFNFCNHHSDLHVGSILYNIRKRYRQDQIYVSFIPNLIFMAIVHIFQ